MKNMAFTAVILYLAGLQTVSAADIDKVAQEVCECSAEAAAFAQEQLDKIANGGSIQDIMAAQEEAMKLMEKVEPCYSALEKKYPDIASDTAKQDEVMGRVKQLCPSPIFGG
jgi:hypothetical protein